MGFTTTPELGLIKPDIKEVIKGDNWVDQNESNMDSIDALRPSLDTALKGWTFIGKAREGSGSSYDIDLTAGGKFPGGTFSQVRLYLRYDLTLAGELVSLRINDITSTNYETARKIWDASAAGLTGVQNTALSRFVIAFGSTVSTNNAIVTLSKIDTGNNVRFQSVSNRQSGSASLHQLGKMWGVYRALLGTPIIKLTVSIEGAESFVNLSWWAEGYRSEV